MTDKTISISGRKINWKGFSNLICILPIEPVNFKVYQSSFTADVIMLIKYNKWNKHGIMDLILLTFGSLGRHAKTNEVNQLCKRVQELI